MRWLLGFLLFNAFMAAGASAMGKRITPIRPEPQPPKPPPKKPEKPRPGAIRRPMKWEFTVRVSGLEKVFVSKDDVKETVLKSANIGPGHGPAQVFIKDHPIGFRIRVEWPDSSQDISPKDAKVLIESTDAKLFRRVSDVKVTRS